MFVQNHHSLEELQRLTKALTKKRIWLRHQAVVLAKQGHSAPAIARALGCSHRAVQAWVGRYNQGGLAALQERPHTGRPPRLAAADVPRFRDRLEAGPTPEDGVCTFRCQDLRRILELSFTHISLLTEVLTAINLAAIFHNNVHLFELSTEPNKNTIIV